jgi:hypothetical protein
MKGMDRYHDSVFLNCPFDESYQPVFHSMIFAVHEAGFLARSALEVQDSGEVRITKIKRIIRECGHGIHDISRTEPDPETGLPRFNMPLELGLFLGAQEYGGRIQRQKRSLILDVDRFRFQRFCSDIAGQDIEAHAGDPGRAITAVRDWLASFRAGELFPGAAKVRSRYAKFFDDLPDLCGPLHLDPGNLMFLEIRTLIEEWTEDNPITGASGVPRTVTAPRSPVHSREHTEMTAPKR